MKGPLLVGVGVGPGAADLLTTRARETISQADSPEERARALPALAERLVEHLDRGEVVAFLTIGDPSMFSVFPSVVAAVRGMRPEVRGAPAVEWLDRPASYLASLIAPAPGLP